MALVGAAITHQINSALHDKCPSRQYEMGRSRLNWKQRMLAFSS
jgi:hypothetical protein